MRLLKKFIFGATACIVLQSIYACEMEGVTQWALPQTLEVVDTERGIVFSRSTSNIVGINTVTHFEGLNAGPYMDVSHTDSLFTISTSDAYSNYEDNETLQSFSITVLFSCTGGSTNILVFLINIKDTNNNAPQFRPSDEYEFTIAPPVPPGFQITGCVNDIIVRDIDLTTQRIEFAIEENPYFEIALDEASDQPKEFKAILRTTTLIRNLRDPVELRITATDVDLTGDPPITSTAVIKIQGDSDFQLPEEPVFGQPFYLASYTNGNQLDLSESITLKQGYDDEVEFSLEGEFVDNFRLVTDGNSVNIEIASPLSSQALQDAPILLVVRAERPDTSEATTTVVISVPSVDGLQFESGYYEGKIVDNELQVSPLVLNQGYETEFLVSINSEYSAYFNAQIQGTNIVLTMTPLEGTILNDNTIIILEVVVSSEFSSATAYVTLEIVKDDKVTPLYEKYIYFGAYEPETGLTLETILVTQGYDESVSYSLDGEYRTYFDMVSSGAAISVTASNIPFDIFVERTIFLTISASKPRTVGATTVISVTLPNARQLSFEAPSYSGTLLDNTLNVEPIVLNVGYNENVTFDLSGDYVEYFSISNEENQVVIELRSFLPEKVILENKFISLHLTASAYHAIAASTTIILDTMQPVNNAPAFSKAYYRGVYTVETGLQIEESIFINQGYEDSLTFSLEGEFATWFSTTNDDNVVSLVLDTDLPEEVLQSNNHIIFTVIASKPDSQDGRAAISIELPKDNDIVLEEIKFLQDFYVGAIENDILTLDYIRLDRGYSENLNITLTGDYVEFFQLIEEEDTYIIQLLSALPPDVFENINLIVFSVEANHQDQRGHATIVIKLIKPEDVHNNNLEFEEIYYTGSYSERDGLAFSSSIMLVEGFDETVEFYLEGENSRWFDLVIDGNSAELSLSSSNAIPSEVLSELWQLIFLVAAKNPAGTTARAVIVIYLVKDEQIGNIEKFDKIVYKGVIRDGVVLHEIITVSGYNGSVVELIGDAASLFTVSNSEGIVTIEGNLASLPSNLTYIVLELEVSGSSAVLILDIEHTDNPELSPVTVTFTSASYTVDIDISQTGLVGRVEATADNGESIEYLLSLDNDHLQQRLSIDTTGGIFLSAPADSGLYNFQVIATTTITRATDTAEVELIVEAKVICEDNSVIPPLIIIDRDEEEAYNNLVVLNASQFPGCQYTLANRWPTNQMWLYVDEYGLHTTAIDREHESIADMVLSQVQVELILICDSDDATSVLSTRNEAWSRNLGPYDYGDRKWILTDAIPYSPRRSLVNLIVNDINDNYPIFAAKENEPIAVGYPISKLEERILPRALIKLKASDADVGENAAIRYWSSEEVLAVSPLTGFVHVRDYANLKNDAVLTVYATDRNGEGLTTSLDLIIKLINERHIAVLTVRYAFLDDEDTVLYELSDAVGYEVKALSTAVVSNAETSTFSFRMKRDLSGTTESSLQLYVYGLDERKPVPVDRLMRDITKLVTTTAVNIARTESLEDYLDSLEICAIPGRDTALLVATIILSVLLFILIVAVAVWMLLRWRKKQNYDQFSDESSLASRNESPGPVAKPDSIPKPRLEIEELRRSEKRLQDMLDAPAEETTITTTIKKQTEPETKVVIPELHAPIVIQSIDKLKDAQESEDEDEFGERLKSKRKSVVTFNENVEKIIVEDAQEDYSNAEYEVYQF